MTEELKEKMDQVRRYLRNHHGNVEPGPEFAQRVLVRLESKPDEPLGLAALRLLPATIALLLLLAWLSIRLGSEPNPTVAQGTGDDVIGWLIEDSETGR